MPLNSRKLIRCVLNKNKLTSTGQNVFKDIEREITVYVKHNYPETTFIERPVTPATDLVGPSVYTILEPISGYYYIYGT